jgi:hypothetical protein
MTPLRTACALALVVLLLPRPAAAEAACATDARRLCPDVPYGGGAVLQCLRERWREVSGACQQDIRNLDNRVREVDASCANDYFRWCQGTPRGQGRILACLGRRWSDLSSTCRDAVSLISERAKRFTDACSADADRLCQGVEPGQGRIFACLKFQERAVSSRCQAAMRP